MERRAIILMLAAAMLASLMIACNDTSVAPATTGTADGSEADIQADETPETEPETDILAARRAEADNLPAEDFGGRDFNVITANDAEVNFYAEEYLGEGVNDAIYDRNLAVYERYNAKVAYIDGGGHKDCTPLIENEIVAGDPAFDLIMYHCVANSANAMKGYYLNWNEVPHIDFSRPWWSDSNVEDLTVNNRCYLAVGDFSLSAIAYLYCMFYDKDEIASYQLEDPYDVVTSGRWTIDYLKTLSEKVYNDSNGNGEVDLEDYFGLTGHNYHTNAFMWAAGNKIFSKDANGEQQFVYYSEHLVNVFDSLYDLFNNTTGVRSNKTESELGAPQLANNGTLICFSVLDEMRYALSEMEHEYGIAPYPKYDENQAEYISSLDGGFDGLAVAKTETDLEFVGIMTEVLCAEGYKQVLPAYYDVCLKQRYSSSPKDAEMIELVVDTRVFDFGLVYDNWQGVAFDFQTLLRKNPKEEITSYYKSKEKMVTNYYQGIIDLFYQE